MFGLIEVHERRPGPSFGIELIEKIELKGVELTDVYCRMRLNADA